MLVVDGDPIFLEQLSSFVKECGYRVQEATDLESAMIKLKRHRLPIAIIDWDLDHGQAIEFIQQIRDNHRLRRTHILVLSMNRDPNIVEISMNAGADDFFTKPIAIKELKSRLMWASNRLQVLV